MPIQTLTIRPAEASDAAAIAEVNQATWRAIYAGQMDEAFLANRSTEEQLLIWKALLTEPNPSCCYFVALEGEKIIAYSGGGRNADSRSPFQAELFVVYVLPEWHGHGIGRRLVGAQARWMRSKGWNSMQTWVWEKNPFRGFYENLEGIRLDQDRELDFGGRRIRVVTYGWPGLEKLSAVE
jgi:GNAT superfamily N-acetyltransferase